MKIIGIIPARGGSKSIRHKAIRPFCGKPLIAWSIESAKKSKALDRIIVFTDSPQIARIARKYGAEVPFFEPAELADGIVRIELVFRYVYEQLKAREGYVADAIAILMPTNPSRQPFHITKAVALFKKGNADSIVSMNETPANHTPYWTFTRHETKGARLFGDIHFKHILNRRQDFPQQCYARNDLIYVLKPKNLYAKPPSLYGKKMEIYETNPVYEIDINTLEEWMLAEIRCKALRKRQP